MTDVPEDLIAALKENGLAGFFAGCTAAHRREYLEWIAAAKRPETRQRRIAQAVKMIAARSKEEAARAQKRA